jgi:soluble lytic murein transglycosylase-like protein
MNLPDTYDGIINQYRKVIPLQYVKTLIYFESAFKPNSDMGEARVKKGEPYSQGAAKGLMQIIGTVRTDYNKRYGTSFTYKDLFTPTVNIAMGCDALNRISGAYNSNHPLSLGINWNSDRWVSLLTTGWNAGYSRGGGVQKIVAYLEDKGYKGSEVTIERVYRYAREAGAAPSFYEEKYRPELRMAWAKRVARTFCKETERLAKTPIG